MRNISERLIDIQDAIERILKYTQEGRYRYDNDELVQTWVTHNLYVIGEATRAIASEFPDFYRSTSRDKVDRNYWHANNPCS